MCIRLNCQDCSEPCGVISNHGNHVLNHPPISPIPIQIPQIATDPRDFWRGHWAQLSRRPAGSALHGGDQHDLCGARWTGETCVGRSRRATGATGETCWRKGHRRAEGPRDFDANPWWKNDVMNHGQLGQRGQLSTVFGQLEPTDSAGNWKREYTIETVLDALRREMSGSQALVDSFQIHKLKVVLEGRFFGLYPEIRT